MSISGGILTSTLLDQIVTPAVFFKFGRHAAEKIFKARDAKKEGLEDEWGEAEKQVEEDATPFTSKISKPILGD